MATFTQEDKEAMAALVEYIVSKAAIGAENLESGLLQVKSTIMFLKTS